MNNVPGENLLIENRQAERIDILQFRVSQADADNAMLRVKLRECAHLFHELSCAMSNRIRSERAFDKYETVADSGRMIAERAAKANGGPESHIEKLQLVHEAAKDFFENWQSETFGDLAHDELERALSDMESTDQTGHGQQ